MVAGPLTRMDQSFGAMKALPSTVVFGVSAESFSGTCALAALIAGWVDALRAGSRSRAEVKTNTEQTRSFFMTGNSKPEVSHQGNFYSRRVAASSTQNVRGTLAGKFVPLTGQSLLHQKEERSD